MKLKVFVLLLICSFYYIECNKQLFSLIENRIMKSHKKQGSIFGSYLEKVQKKIQKAHKLSSPNNDRNTVDHEKNVKTINKKSSSNKGLHPLKKVVKTKKIVRTTKNLKKGWTLKKASNQEIKNHSKKHIKKKNHYKKEIKSLKKKMNKYIKINKKLIKQLKHRKEIHRHHHHHDYEHYIEEDDTIIM